jgi:hypothetical protein
MAGADWKTPPSAGFLPHFDLAPASVGAFVLARAFIAASVSALEEPVQNLKELIVTEQKIENDP